MEKEFVPYELALELKEIGFDEPCLGYYKKDKLENTQWDYLTSQEKVNYIFGTKNDSILSPTFSQSFRWFREKCNLRSTIIPLWLSEDKFMVVIEGKIILDNKNKIIEYNSHEEAELECLKKLIKIVKNK